MGFLDEVREREASLAATPVVDREAVAAAEARRNREAYRKLVSDFLVAAKERGVRPREIFHPRNLKRSTGIIGWQLFNSFGSYVISEDGQAYVPATGSYAYIAMDTLDAIPLKITVHGDDAFLKDELMRILFQ
jgi:hypothetical protein